MNCARQLIRVALSLVAATTVASCSGSAPPVDATRQIDDFPRLEKPIARLKHKSLAKEFHKECSEEVLATLRPTEAEKRPEMMAIGGSVFNGVSSMQMNWWLTDWSPPAQVARALAGGTQARVPASFKVPRYPDDGLDPYGTTVNGEPHFRLGLDLETMDIHWFNLVEKAFRRQGWVMSNFDKHRPTGGPALNDNLSFAGAAVDDILYGTARDYRARLDAVRRIDRFEPDADGFWADGAQQSRTYRRIMEHAKKTNGIKDIAKTAGPLKTIFFALNSSFVLNPTRNPCLEHMTPLDQVRLRKPKRLLIGVGSNSGLFTFLSAGQPIDKMCGDIQFSYGEVVREEKRYVSIRQTAKEEFLASMQELLNRLSSDAKAIDHIYVMGQLRPRMIANLDPKPDRGVVGLEALYPPGRPEADPTTYHDQYFLDFAPGGSGRWLSGRELRLADELNDEVNNALEGMVKAQNAREGKRRFVFVDLKPLERYDVRHVADRDVLKRKPGVNVDPARKKQPGETGVRGQPIIVTDAHLNGLGERTIKLDNKVLSFSRGEETITDSHGRTRQIGQQIKAGGIFSIDNLHPTVVGYALLAQELLDTIVEAEKLNLTPEVRASISPERAYAMTMGGGKEITQHGNVLRRLDKGLATRQQLLQSLFDAGANIAGGLDCWRKSGDVR